MSTQKDNKCKCGAEMQPGIDYCSEECFIKYECDDNQDDAVWIGNGRYINGYDEVFEVES